jgi:hypothetical protein
VNPTKIVVDTNILGGCLWTEDAELKTGLRAKGYDRFFEV